MINKGESKKHFNKPFLTKELIHSPVTNFSKSDSIPNKLSDEPNLQPLETVCDDHNKDGKSSRMAEKYCNVCNKYLCNECVIYSHGEHIKEAKYTILDSIAINSTDVENLNKKIKKLNEEFYSKEYSNRTPNFLMILNNQCLSFISELESIKKTLDSLIESEKNFQQKVGRICDEYFKRKVGFKLKDLEEGFKDIHRLSNWVNNDWNKADEKSKIDMIKQSFAEGLKTKYNKLKESMSSLRLEKIEVLNTMDQSLAVIQNNLIDKDKLKELTACFDDLFFQIKNNSNTVNINLFKNHIKIVEVPSTKKTDGVKKNSNKKKESTKKNLRSKSSKAKKFKWSEKCDICHIFGDLLYCEKCYFTAHLACKKFEKVLDFYLCDNCNHFKDEVI